MDERARKRLELFAQNAQAVKEGFFWQDASVRRLAALLPALQDRPADVAALRRCLEMLRENTGMLSYFRGNSALTVAALLSLREDPQVTLADTLTVYGLLKGEGFHSCDHLAISAVQIAAGAPPQRHPEVVARAKAFYTGMRSDHFLLTGQDDYIFAAMLGLSDLDVAQGTERLERLYQAMRPLFFSASGVQSLAQVLLLGGGAAADPGRMEALRDALRDQGLRMEGSYTLSSLGLLSLLPAGIDALVGELAETAEEMHNLRGFSGWSVSKQERLLLSVGLVAANSLDQARQGVLSTALTTSIANLVIAQQSAMAAGVAASAAASAST